jgi:hypothetical protein
MFLGVGIVGKVVGVWLCFERFDGELFVKVECIRRRDFVKDLLSVFRGEFRVETPYDDSRTSLY